jgi:hypothetical protein
MAADLAAKAIAAEIEARMSALIIVEQGRWYNAIIQPPLALPVVIFMWKVIVWDKVLALSDVDGRARGPLRGRAILQHGRRRESAAWDQNPGRMWAKTLWGSTTRILCRGVREGHGRLVVLPF